MTWEIWFAYVAATMVLVTVPGPTVMLVVGYALSSGRRSAWSTVPGVALGDLTAMTVSIAGLGAVLAASAQAFTALKWIGAAYLVYLGLKMWRAVPDVDPLTVGGADNSGRRMTAHAFAVTALNPKGIAFFVAFLPQFVSPAAPLVPQFLVLGATFLVLATVNAAAYAMLAGTVRDRLLSPRLHRVVNRLGGGVLIAAGVLMATLRRVS